MEKRVSKPLRVTGLLVLACLLQLAAPASAVSYPPAVQPIWASVNATANGNYPGGNELFTVFVVNSAQPPYANETVDNMTLTAPFPGGSNFGGGLPAQLVPGNSILVSIYLPIPSNFTQSSFKANLVVHARVWNGTGNEDYTLTGTAPVNVFALSSQSSSETTLSSAQSSAQSGSISTTLFAAGVAIPSIIVILLLALLVQARAASKRTVP
jgi:hypothetical protein